MADNSKFIDLTDREEMELVVTSPSGRKETIIVVADPEMAAKIRSKDPDILSKIISSSTGKQSTEIGQDLNENDNEATTSFGNTDVWTKTAESNLLTIYKEIESSKKPMKLKWNYVSKEMGKLEYKFSGEKCRLKIKNLKERHIRLQKKLNKTGSENPGDPLERDMDDTFSAQPDVNPSFTIDSAKYEQSLSSDGDDEPKAKTSEEEDEATMVKKKSSKIKIESNSQHSDSDDEPKKKALKVEPGANQKRKCLKTKGKHSTNSKQDITQLLSMANEDAKRRHEERMSLQKDLIGVLKAALEKK